MTARASVWEKENRVRALSVATVAHGVPFKCCVCVCVRAVLSRG